MVCKKCLIDKPKISTGKQSKSKNFLYVDEHGRLWKGNICPDCQAKNRREKYKGKNEK